MQAVLIGDRSCLAQVGSPALAETLRANSNTAPFSLLDAKLSVLHILHYLRSQFASVSCGFKYFDSTRMSSVIGLASRGETKFEPFTERSIANFATTFAANSNAQNTPASSPADSKSGSSANSTPEKEEEAAKDAQKASAEKTVAESTPLAAKDKEREKEPTEREKQTEQRARVIVSVLKQVLAGFQWEDSEDEGSSEALTAAIKQRQGKGSKAGVSLSLRVSAFVAHSFRL